MHVSHGSGAGMKIVLPGMDRDSERCVCVFACTYYVWMCINLFNYSTSAEGL